MAWTAAASVVGGSEPMGLSTTVVTPPAAAARLRLAHPSELGRLIRDIGSDRVLFGNDFPWYELDGTVDQLMALPHLSDEERRGILGENAIRRIELTVTGADRPGRGLREHSKIKLFLDVHEGRGTLGPMVRLTTPALPPSANLARLA